MKRFKIPFAVLAAVALVLFFTNPDQAAHLKAIQDTLKLRNPAYVENPILRVSSFNNYYVFSTVGIGEIIYSRGCFGRVEVTDNIRLLDGIPIN